MCEWYRVAVIGLAMTSLGASSYESPNFQVHAPTKEIARQAALAAEKSREELAVVWLGKKMPRWSARFVALYCLSGIPIFAMALGQFASVFVQRILAARERAALKRTISPEEYAFAERIFSADGHLDWS